MARVTVEDCLGNVKNRFELVIVAAKRAREIMLTGSDPTVPWDNDKSTVVALREVAAGYVTAEILEDKPAENDEPEIILQLPENEVVEPATDASSEDKLLVVANQEPTAQDNLI